MLPEDKPLSRKLRKLFDQDISTHSCFIPTSQHARLGDSPEGLVMTCRACGMKWTVNSSRQLYKLSLMLSERGRISGTPT